MTLLLLAILAPTAWSIPATRFLTSDLRYNPTPMSWPAARDYCRQFSNADKVSADLVSITSEDENQLVSSIADGASAWIGFSDQESEGAWRWSDGTAPSFTKWFPGEPNDDNHISDDGQNYAIINWADETGWDDQTGSNALPSVCWVSGCDDCAGGVKSSCCAVEDEDDLSGDASREVVGAVVAIFAIVCTVYVSIDARSV
ncbi:hypothetical protein TeGR_g13062 [Tetraparma gracilis]|uniref:C-type lectin domain-containing protein n=1 Tax=Tetraparma gracilis TaxID=2962635 RepID=A0ABQ6MSY6_9STRA|nr:hypothetical protein TeGR_g13062 [Tetraparma gracilis]